ncbi:MAG: hypothetical protein KIH64_011740 [Mycobacterium sp.]|nr:hypothetical protein [Mycobacterium sp.]
MFDTSTTDAVLIDRIRESARGESVLIARRLAAVVSFTSAGPLNEDRRARIDRERTIRAKINAECARAHAARIAELAANDPPPF